MRVPLQAWSSAQTIGDEMLWKGAWGAQVQYLRDRLSTLVGAGLDYEDSRDIAHVISTHRSKSIVLPVCELARPDLGLRLILRNNFYDWKISVVSKRPIVADFSGLFHTTPPIDPTYTGNQLAPVYFEGFLREWVFGYYAESDGRQWSASVGGDAAIWATVFLVMRALGAIKPLIWHTQESHRKELDAQTERRKAREATRTAP